MKRKKGFKVIVGSLIVSTLISSQSFAISNFLDMPSDVMDKEPINKAVENKIIKGYKGYVKPNDKLTKAEMVTILNRLFNTPESKKEYVLKDVSKNDWYYNEILKGIDSGIISLENGNINPEETVDLEMVSKFLQTAIQNQVYGFNTSQLDKLNVSVERLAEMLSNGNSKNDSKNNVTKKGLKRSEFIRLIDQLVYTVINNKGEYNLNDIDGNVLIKASEVVIKNSKIKGNLILTNIDNSKSILVLDNVTVNETIVLRPGQKLILKNGSKVNKVIVNGSSKEIVNIDIEGNSKIKTIISDSDINLSNSKNKKVDIYTKEAYKNKPENKNKLDDPLLNDDYLIIEIPEVKPEEKNPEVKPEEKNPEVKPEEKNPEVKPEEKNPEVKPEEKDPEVKPEEKNPEVKPEEKNPEVKPEEKNPEVKPEEKNPEVKPEEKDPELKPEEKDPEVKPEENVKLEEIKHRIDSLPKDKEEILKNYNEIVELVGLFNSLTKDEKIYLKEEHIKLTKVMYVIQDNNISNQLEDFLDNFKVDGIYNYETIILNKDIINEKLSLIDNLSKPLEGKLKEDIDSLNNILSNEKAYKFIAEIEKLVDKNYNDKDLLENRDEVDILINGFVELNNSERDIVYKENHDKLEEIASRLEMLLHLELIDYLEDAISKLPEDRETLLTMEDDLDELVNSYNYLVENNLGISKEYYEKLQTSINYFVFKDADKIKNEIEKLGNDYNSIIENEDEILLLKEKYDNLEEIEKNRIGNTIDKLNTSINIIENKDIYSIGERILKIPNNKETILNYYDEIYKLIEELTPISNNEIDKFNLISEEYKYLLELREALESKVAYDIAEEIRLLPEDIDGIFREKEKINLLIRKIDPLNANQRLLIDKEYKMLRKKVDILQGERGYNFRKKLVGLPTEVDEIFAQKEDLLKLIQEYNTLSAYDMYLLTEEYKEINRIALVLSRENVYKMQKELLNLPTEVEEIFENKEYLQGLIARYNSLSPDEMHILSNEYKHLRHVANVLSSEKGYMFVNKIQDLPEDKDVILSNQYELSALVTEFNQLAQNDKDVVYGKDKKLRYVADILASVRAIELGKEITESIHLDVIEKNLNDDNYYEILNIVGRLNEKYNDESLYGKHHIIKEHKILYEANTLLINYAKKLDNETIKVEENDKDEIEEEIICEIEKDLDTQVDNKESEENKYIIEDVIG